MTLKDALNVFYLRLIHLLHLIKMEFATTVMNTNLKNFSVKKKLKNFYFNIEKIIILTTV